MGNVINMIGGGKPEQEKTVTAGTSVTEVIPDSGKVLSKVTVNPTPSQAKSVTPSASQKIVTPDSGKLLSQVIVAGDSDLVAGNIKKGVNVFGTNGTFDNSTGLYVWKKCQNDTDHTFVDYAVSNSENTYPDKAVHTDGYYYEKVVEGLRMATGSFSWSSSSKDTIAFTHGLGVVPQYVLLYRVPSTNTGSTLMAIPFGRGSSTPGNFVIYIGAYGEIVTKVVTPTITENEYSCDDYGIGYYWASGEYYWVAFY